MHITFILPVANDALYNRRIEALARCGAICKVTAFERNYYAGKPLDGGYISLGRVEHGKYFKRIIPLARAFGKVRHEIRNADTVYVFGLDVLLLGWLASRGLRKKPQFVYEVDDVREVLIGQGMVSGLLRWVERWAVRRAALLVVTSEAYITGYYQGVLGVKGLRYQVIENKLDIESVPRTQAPAPDHRRTNFIRIGYFELIRCERSFEALKKIAEQAEGRIEIYIRGIPMNISGLKDAGFIAPWVNYGGSYVSPDDLPEMYSQVDMVWIAHYHAQTNLLWARAHRFYEACFFGKPMIAQTGTEDGRVVEARNIGLCVDLASIDDCVKTVLGLTPSAIADWVTNVRRLPRDICTYGDEHAKLLEKMDGLLHLKEPRC